MAWGPAGCCENLSLLQVRCSKPKWLMPVSPLRNSMPDWRRGKRLFLLGPYPYIDGVYRYCQRHERALVSG